MTEVAKVAKVDKWFKVTEVLKEANVIKMGKMPKGSKMFKVTKLSAHQCIFISSKCVKYEIWFSSTEPFVPVCRFV